MTTVFLSERRECLKQLEKGWAGSWERFPEIQKSEVLWWASGCSRRTLPYLLLGKACSDQEKDDPGCTPRQPGVVWGPFSVLLNLICSYQLMPAVHLHI